MLNKNFLAQILFSLAVFLTVFATSVSAVGIPPRFPSCSDPEGNLKVSYPSGTHGIPGKIEPYTGSDKVYSLSDGNLTQCFCPETGAGGIQTNWWKIPALTSGEIEDFKTQGWTFVPDGLAWGLDPVAYLAKNYDYTCRAIGGGATVGDVLGLAATGNIGLIYSFLLIGLLSLMIGYLLRVKRV